MTIFDGKLKIPLIPPLENSKFVDDKGNLTEVWQKNLTQLYSQLNKTITINGLKVPPLPATEITTERAVGIGDGIFVYDSTNNLLKVTINGDFKTIMTS